MVGWPHGHDGGRERAPRPAVHDEGGSAHGEWMATRRPPVAWAALDGAVYAAPLSGGRKAAAALAHGVAHLLLLVAGARKPPGDRAAQG